MKTAKTPTPDAIATYGHIAARVRAELTRRNMTVRQLNLALGVRVDSSMPYMWMTCRSAPNPTMRGKLAKILAIPETELMKREGGQQAPVPAVIEPRAQRPAEVLAFTINNAGEARIRLDTSLPVERAMPLVRMLLDAGLVLARQHIEEVG